MSEVAKTAARHERLIAELEVWRQGMRDSGQVSAPRELGVMLIVASGANTDHRYSAELHARNLVEAELARQVYEADGRYAGAVVCPEATVEVFQEAMADRRIAGLHVIGHGTLNRLFIVRETPEAPGFINWFDLARWGTHLKREFVQMTCAHIAVANSVPMGTFIVDDLENARFFPGGILPDHAVADYRCIARTVLNNVEPIQEQLGNLNAEYYGRQLQLDVNGQVVDDIVFYPPF